MKKMYKIQLVEKYNGKTYPKYIELDKIYLKIEDAIKARDAWKISNPNNNFFPVVISVTNMEE